MRPRCASVPSARGIHPWASLPYPNSSRFKNLCPFCWSTAAKRRRKRRPYSIVADLLARGGNTSVFRRWQRQHLRGKRRWTADLVRRGEILQVICIFFHISVKNFHWYIFFNLLNKNKKSFFKNKLSIQLFVSNLRYLNFNLLFINLTRGAKTFEKNIFLMFTGKMSGLLTLLAIPSIVKVLVLTKQSEEPHKAFRRYVDTIRHMLFWYRSRLQDPKSLYVRMRMNTVSWLTARDK